MNKFTALTFITTFSLASSVLLNACGPKGKAPSIPSGEAVTENGRDTASQNPLANQRPSDKTSVPPDESSGAPGGPPSDDPAAAPSGNLLDATVAFRLNDLPTALRTQVKQCEDEGHVFDLGSQTCLIQAPAKIACVINDDFKTKLDSTTIEPLDQYIITKIPEHRLYACTEDDTVYSLHFFRMQTDGVNYRRLNITKKLN
jgi:hypothetical protein